MPGAQPNRARIFAIVLALGACVLLVRPIPMIRGSALTEQLPWVASLLLLESIMDAAAIVFCIRWWSLPNEQRKRTALCVAAFVTVLHAVRVLIFVLGRTELLRDFEIRPAYRPLSPESWSWGEVYFAATMSLLALLCLLVVRMRRRTRKWRQSPE